MRITLEERKILTPKKMSDLTNGELTYTEALELMKTKGFPSFKFKDSSNRLYVYQDEFEEYLERQKKKPKY